jgi:hypothetical protein
MNSTILNTTRDKFYYNLTNENIEFIIKMENLAEEPGTKIILEEISNLTLDLMYLSQNGDIYLVET